MIWWFTRLLGGVYLGSGRYTIETARFDVGTLSAIGDTFDTARIDLEGTAQQQGIFLNTAGATFTLNGDARLIANGNVALENDGALVHDSASVSAVNGNLTNNGTIVVSAGTLVMKALGGTGQDVIGASATLDLAQTLGTEQSVSFSGSGGTLTLADPRSIASLADFSVGDHLDLHGFHATGCSISGTLLTVTSAGGSLTFGSAGLLGAQAVLATNAHGDALITVGAGH